MAVVVATNVCQQNQIVTDSEVKMGLMDRESGGGGKDQDPHQVTTFNGARHVQGQCVERVDGEGVHVLTLQGILRIRRHGDSPVGLRQLVSSSRYRRVLCFL